MTLIYSLFAALHVLGTGQRIPVEKIKVIITFIFDAAYGKVLNEKFDLN